jgi:pectate lyase
MSDLFDHRVGFAAGVTGGYGGEDYVVTNLDDSGPGSLRHALEASDPLWITSKLTGTIKLKNNLKGQFSNKTIDGRGSKLTLVGFALAIGKAKNVIVHNIILTKSGGDGIQIMQSDLVWIDRCTLSDCFDGLCDATHGETADKNMRITISRCHLSKHNKGMAFGLGSRNKPDENIRVTRYRNYCDGLTQRSPRVEGAWCHDINNYVRYESMGSQCYGKGRLLVERNWYRPAVKGKNLTKAIHTADTKLGAGKVYLSKCKFYDGCSGKATTKERPFTPPYKIPMLDATDSNLAKIKADAGWYDDAPTA